MDTISQQHYINNPCIINIDNSNLNSTNRFLAINNVGCLASDIKSISLQLLQNNGDIVNGNIRYNSQLLNNVTNSGNQVDDQNQNQNNIVTPITNLNSNINSLRNNIYHNKISIITNSANGLSDNINGNELKHGSQILCGHYLLLNQITGSSFHNCMDIKTGELYICKAIGNSYAKIVSAYFRMDDCEHIKPLHKLLKSSSDIIYLLLPPSQYGDLHSFVRERKRLREPEARYLFRQICKTVKECHDQGIVLRDLKLRKFVFSNKERTHLKFESLEDAVVLNDYENDILKEKIGCPAYVAPEILKPNSNFSGKAADLWSLGVILYTMLVGRYPFNDPEHASLFAKISRCTFIIPDFVSPKARCLIKSLLQKVPKHRLLSEDLLDHQWFQEDKTNNFVVDNCNSCISDEHNNRNGASTAVSIDDHCVPEFVSPLQKTVCFT